MLLSLVAVCCLSSCTSQSYVSNFSNFVDQTDAHCHQYSARDWERNISKFKDYSITRFSKEKSRLTSDQIKEVLRLDARYVAIASSQGVMEAKSIIDDVKNIGPEVLGDFLDQFLKRTGKK